MDQAVELDNGMFKLRGYPKIILDSDVFKLQLDTKAFPKDAKLIELIRAYKERWLHYVSTDSRMCTTIGFLNNLIHRTDYFEFRPGILAAQGKIIEVLEKRVVGPENWEEFLRFREGQQVVDLDGLNGSRNKAALTLMYLSTKIPFAFLSNDVQLLKRLASWGGAMYYGRRLSLYRMQRGDEFVDYFALTRNSLPSLENLAVLSRP